MIERRTTLIKVVKEKRAKIKENLSELAVLEKIIKDLKSESKADHKKIENIYLAMLKRNSDNKPEGLSGYLKELIDLGINIESLDKNNFPSFFDTKAIKYLIKVLI